MSREAWPAIPYPAWKETCSALHLWSQVVGKYRLARTPWVNHSWHATFYVTPRGLTTGPIPDGERTTQVDFDFCDHRLIVRAGCATSGFSLGEMSIAGFYEKTRDAIAEVGGTPTIHGTPNEIPHVTPFREDRERRPYDAEAVERFHRALLRVARVFEHFRTSYLGKVSPVHLFWGALDLAVTRFSGRRAPLHPGGFDHLPDEVAREAYSHEVSSAGFWPGGNGVEEAMFYSYAYPEPPGFRDRKVEPPEARFDETLGEFLLPYEVVRTARDPEAALLAFLFSTYEAAADTGAWPREELECALGTPGIPRSVTT